jgi:hypothetical protein
MASTERIAGEWETSGRNRPERRIKSGRGRNPTLDGDMAAMVARKESAECGLLIGV